MVAGTSSARTSVASTTIATIMPTPISLMYDIPPVAKPATTMINSNAAAVMIRPVCWRPLATAVVLSAVLSHSSQTRESRNTT